MAVYTFRDIVNAINSDDKAAIADIAGKYPLPFAIITKACVLAPDAMADVAALVDDSTTGTKMNAKAKASVSDSKPVSEPDAVEDDEEEEKPAEAPKKRRGRPRKTEVAEDAAEKPAPKRRGRPKKVVEPEPETVEDDSTEDENPYAGKKAMELYKMCKERGIDVQPRQKAQVYADLLIADDAEGVDDSEFDDEDEWDI